MSLECMATFQIKGLVKEMGFNFINPTTISTYILKLSNRRDPRYIN